MKDEDFKKQLITKLMIEDVAPDVQGDLLIKLEDVAHARVGNMLPELLSKEQLAHIGELRKAKKSDEEILEWVQAQLPHFKEMMQALLMDIADEINEATKEK